MAYADNDGGRIHYQVEGDGPPLVLQHGYSDSLESWYEFGYVEPLKSGRKVILVDARGHGASDKPHISSEYTKELQAADIVAVLRISTFHMPTTGATQWAVKSVSRWHSTPRTAFAV
jgi:pimeloyl-ACP methyl ester carboxylesterase